MRVATHSAAALTSRRMRNGMGVSSTCDAGRPAAASHATRTFARAFPASNVSGGTYPVRVARAHTGIAVAQSNERIKTVSSLTRNALIAGASAALTLGLSATSSAQIIVPGYPYPGYRYAAPDA